MAQLVFGVGDSHTPLLNGEVADWARFIEVDRAHRDKDGNPVTYDDPLRMAGMDKGWGSGYAILDDILAELRTENLG